MFAQRPQVPVGRRFSETDVSVVLGQVDASTSTTQQSDKAEPLFRSIGHL